MGLDMYLEAETLVYWGKHADPRFAQISAATLVKPDAGSPWFTVSAPVAYWRKCNAVHKWFVDHVQGGEDNCGRYPVSREQLEALRSVCLYVVDTVETVGGDVKDGTTHYPDGRVIQHSHVGQVVAQPEVAAARLPTQPGCFFGSTDYDERYLADLRHTVAMLTHVLNDPALASWEFYYRASW